MQERKRSTNGMQIEIVQVEHGCLELPRSSRRRKTCREDFLDELAKAIIDIVPVSKGMARQQKPLD